MKENFYVFLDIDGVLWSWPYRKREIKLGNIKMGSEIREFDPKSMHALTVLLNSLNKRYQVNLVISSTWNDNMNRVSVMLNKYNIPKVYKIDKTNGVGARGALIEDYLKNKTDNQNFVIIDDETSDMPQFLNSGNIIKTKGMFGDSITIMDVTKHLNKIGVPVVTKEMLKFKDDEMER